MKATQFIASLDFLLSEHLITQSEYDGYFNELARRLQSNGYFIGGLTNLQIVNLYFATL